jgi:hypothetical protein
MKAKIDVTLEPFSVPNFVRRDKKGAVPGDDATPAFPLSDVDEAALSALCDQFREAVFAKAGKADPRLK